MKIIIVYDSVFGNTEKVARAMGEVLKQKNDITVLKAKNVKINQLNDVDLLIVGSPTRAFNPTDDIKKFLKSSTIGKLDGVKVAGFDTRANIKEVNSAILTLFAKLFGYAAGKITKKLTKNGGQLISEPRGFFVKDSEGPMADGEIERAEKWALSLIKI